MRHHHNSSYLPGAAMMVFLAMAILYLPWLGETLFNSKGEPREAIVAVSMLHSGNWILPVNYGADIPFKPPFLAWLIAGFAWLLNGGVVNEYISRLPSALALIAMVMAGFRWAQRARGTRFAIIMSLVTVTSFEVFRAGMACRLDMVLTACMVGAMYMLHDLRERRPPHKALRYVAVIVLLTCATLTKGPVGSMLPCFVMGVYCLLRRDRFFPTLFRMLGLAAVSLIVPAWWTYEAWQMGGQHFIDLMMEENFGRLFGTMSYESHVNPIWYNFVTLIAGLLPWTIVLLMMLFTTRRWRRDMPGPYGLFALTAAVLVVGFYCIPESKRSVYLLPAYPFICYGIASAIESVAAVKPVKVFTWFMAVLAVIVPVAIVVLGFVQLPKLPIETIPWWRYIFLMLPMAAGIAWMCNRHSPVAHSLVIVWALYVAYISTAMPAILNPRSDHRVLDRLTENPEARVVSYPDGSRLYTLSFYLDDAIRDAGDLDELPKGTLMLIDTRYDTTGLAQKFKIEPLLPRSCDHRNCVVLGTKQ